MRVLAIITEYNPFHNGHLWQIRRARELIGCDYLLILQSGAFVQRGEPAVLDKWTRARMALAGGADAVLELNSSYALSSASRFAAGAVRLLEAAGIVTDLCFGAETADLSVLKKLSESRQEDVLLHALAEGKSYPAAEAIAHAADLTPNDILAMEYLRALEDTESSIQPHVLPRVSGHGKEGISEFTSARAIRTAWAEKRPADEAMPFPVCAQEALHTQGGPASLEQLSPLFFYRVRTADPQDLLCLPEIGQEGLENRILRAFSASTTLEEALQNAKTKRYTMARIKRTLCHLLLGRTREGDLALARPDHLRLLGFRTSASPLLRALQDRSLLPLVNKVADAEMTPHLQSDIRAQNLWALSTPALRKQNLDYVTSPVLYRE
ncbi:MAG: nucleotidyltransferase family protein [Clostridia bacterium]|nr:nucleotidyltransferase family protein [Clostridia bacterium]